MENPDGGNMSRLEDFRDIWKADRFLYYFLIPLWVLNIYFFAFSQVLPKGVNKVFVTRLGKYALLATVFLSIAYFVFIKIRGVTLSKEKASWELYFGDIILLFLPLTPVTQYIFNNLEVLSFIEIIYIFLVCAFVIAVFEFVVPILLKQVGSMRTMMFLGLAFVFVIADMANLSWQFSWLGSGSLKIQILVFGGVFLLSWFLFHLNFRKFFYLLVVVLFFTTNLPPLLNNTNLMMKGQESTGANLSQLNNKLLRLIGSEKPPISPNIYLLVYDAYVGNETMLAHGIDNSPQEQYLEKLGFKIYPHTYSIGAASTASMSTVLNASNDYYGRQRVGVSGNGVVTNLLEGFGYKTYGVFPSDFYFRGIIPGYDYSFPAHDKLVPFTANSILIGILMGEFRFDIDFDKVSREQYREEKLRVFSETLEVPKFIYTHSHSPGHSQNSGACLPNEEELYEERLLKANALMKQDIETISEKDPSAIMIVAGDHGPYLTKNCIYTDRDYDISEITRLDIQDRYGAFLAIRWPTQNFEEYDDIGVLQDLFPVIFAYMFEDPDLLEAKVSPETITPYRISGASVVDGIIKGGKNNDEPLFIGEHE